MSHSDISASIFERKLPTPNVLSYFFSGAMLMDETIASSACIGTRDGTKINTALFNKLKLPTDIFPPIVPPGTSNCLVLPEVLERCNIKSQKVSMTIVAGHDTPCGLISVKNLGENDLFISSGTMMLIGYQSKKPFYSTSMMNQFIRTIKGYHGAYACYKDVQGFWILNQVMAEYAQNGTPQYFEQLEAEAKELPHYVRMIDVNNPMFVSAQGSMIERIRNYCKNTSQTVPESAAEIYRCLMDSYAMAVRKCISDLQMLTGKRFESIKLFNGGVQSNLLCSCISEATGLPLYTGARYATAIGNALCQLVSNGDVSSVAEANELFCNSSFENEFFVAPNSKAEDSYQKYLCIIKCNG